MKETQWLGDPPKPIKLKELLTSHRQSLQVSIDAVDNAIRLLDVNPQLEQMVEALQRCTMGRMMGLDQIRNH